jgi:hypothetical protein
LADPPSSLGTKSKRTDTPYETITQNENPRSHMDLNVEMKHKLETEILPRIKEQLEGMRRRLEKIGKEEKLKHVEQKLETISVLVLTTLASSLIKSPLFFLFSFYQF